MGNRTPLYSCHLDQQAKMVDFGGWDMPIHYGSQIEEHHSVRSHAGVFDVSHMAVVDISGAQAGDYLRYLLANDVDRIPAGKALYSALLNTQGGVIDDLIAYRRNDNRQDYRLVVNCARRDVDLDWMKQQQSGFEVTIMPRPELAMLAVQGPQARALAAPWLATHGLSADDLPVFGFTEQDACFVARTGYTGEDGLEIILPADLAIEFWQHLLDADVAPCGLGARDTLRLEAGMNLYGHEMDEHTSPFAANMAWTLVFNEGRDFIGRAALEAQREQPHDELLGLVLEGRGVLRAEQQVKSSGGQGVVTSGTFSPTLGKSIGLARLPAGTRGRVDVDIRGRLQPALIVKPPFVRKGQVVYQET